MPDAAATAQTAPSTQKGAHLVNPDRVGEELADDANIWHVYSKIAKEDDERRIKSWENGLNNLALFAGLFSAVTTAFIIEAQQDMKPDYAELTFLVLKATASGEKFVQQPFVIPSGARTVNCLWVTSLVLSLCAALIAILGKDWIVMYSSRPSCNLRQWAEMRTYRLVYVECWYMSGVIAAAPVLLHTSLLSFGAGLVVFISSDSVAHRLTLGLCLAAGTLYVVTALSAIVFSTSPFKSPASQMLRQSLSVFLSRVRDILVYRPRRNLVGTLLGSLNIMIVPRADHFTTLPGLFNPALHQLQGRHSLAQMFSASYSPISAFMRSIPVWLCASRDNLRWSIVKLRTKQALSGARAGRFNEWFTSASWTDISVDRRPELIAASLSWMNGASQAPDVFRALVFALGDLEIGPQVAPLISPDLRTRFGAEMRRVRRQVDFLTLSRYVLAFWNLHGRRPMHLRYQFDMVDVRTDPSLPCEDALVAAVILQRPSDIVAKYVPLHAVQGRMIAFLLPTILQKGPWDALTLTLLANLYRTTFPGYSSFKLEDELYRRLSERTIEEYTATVKTQYGGDPGPVELLTFLCCRRQLDYPTLSAAIELVMHAIWLETLLEHRCLVYLFGRYDLRHAAWKSKRWSTVHLSRLYFSLQNSLRRLRSNDMSAQRDSNGDFTVALARALAMVISPQQYASVEVTGLCIGSLSALLCHPAGLLDNDGGLDIIRLILEEATLYKIIGSGFTCWPVSDELAGWATAILATITTRIRVLLRNPTTRRTGVQLFRQLVFATIRTNGNESATWDLGAWLRSHASNLIAIFPSTTIPMQRFHDAMTVIHSLSAENDELRAMWDYLGFPGGPADIFRYPFVDVGEFFLNAEAPGEPPIEILRLSSASSLDLGRFFNLVDEAPSESSSEPASEFRPHLMPFWEYRG